MPSGSFRQCQALTRRFFSTALKVMSGNRRATLARRHWRLHLCGLNVSFQGNKVEEVLCGCQCWDGTAKEQCLFCCEWKQFHLCRSNFLKRDPNKDLHNHSDEKSLESFSDNYIVVLLCVVCLPAGIILHSYLHSWLQMWRFLSAHALAASCVVLRRSGRGFSAKLCSCFVQVFNLRVPFSLEGGMLIKNVRSGPPECFYYM